MAIKLDGHFLVCLIMCMLFLTSHNIDRGVKEIRLSLAEDSVKLCPSQALFHVVFLISY